MSVKDLENNNKESLLQPGRNCWRLANADRVAVLIETSEYFETLKVICRQAQHCIFVLGWDFDRREKLGREEDAPTIEEFLKKCLQDNENLNIYLLLWDYHLIYAAERENFLGWRMQLAGHERLHLEFDDQHPTGGSHHQKIVVADDAVALSGGIDLSRWRWDTSDHKPTDTRRIDPDGDPYPPFHDMMMMVDGEAAASLGELVRDRWRHSGASDPVPGPCPQGGDLWPDEVTPLFTGQSVAIARTVPELPGQSAIGEVGQLYLDSIATACDYIYLENQYFTSRTITTAIAERLQDEHGPDVVIVLPAHTGGWLEQVTMDAIRDRQLQSLADADHHDRLRIYYPHQPGLPEDECISVHAKFMIIDGRFVRVGSANTSERSLGLDTECDLALENFNGEDIPWLLHRLLAEHLDCRVEQVAESLAEHRSLAAAVEAMVQPEGRSLRPLDYGVRDTGLEVAAEADLIDPEEPVNPQYFVRRAITPADKPTGHVRLYLFIGFIVAMLLLAAAWRWTPLSEFISPDRLSGLLKQFEDPVVRSSVVLVGVVITSLLMVPLSALVVVCALILGPWTGFVVAMAGALISGGCAFVAGSLMGGKLLQRFSGSRVHSLSERLSERGVMAVAVLRLLPVAPYTVVNLVAGASHLRLGTFMLGSTIGLLPGVAAITAFSGTLFEAVMNPNLKSLGILAGVTAVIAVAALGLRRLLKTS